MFVTERVCDIWNLTSEFSQLNSFDPEGEFQNYD